MVTFVDVLIFDEPYKELTSQILEQEFIEKFEKLKSYYVRSEAFAGDKPETYLDLIIRGRARMQQIQKVLTEMDERSN